jgi:hypothetical protein
VQLRVSERCTVSQCVVSGPWFETWLSRSSAQRQYACAAVRRGRMRNGWGCPPPAGQWRWGRERVRADLCLACSLVDCTAVTSLFSLQQCESERYAGTGARRFLGGMLGGPPGGGPHTASTQHIMYFTNYHLRNTQNNCLGLKSGVPNTRTHKVVAS